MFPTIFTAFAAALRRICLLSVSERTAKNVSPPVTTPTVADVMQLFVFLFIVKLLPVLLRYQFWLRNIFSENMLHNILGKLCIIYKNMVIKRFAYRQCKKFNKTLETFDLL